jgi:hypothetical protein
LTTFLSLSITDIHHRGWRQDAARLLQVHPRSSNSSTRSSVRLLTSPRRRLATASLVPLTRSLGSSTSHSPTDKYTLTHSQRCRPRLPEVHHPVCGRQGFPHEGQPHRPQCPWRAFAPGQGQKCCGSGEEVDLPRTPRQPQIWPTRTQAR